LEHFSLSRTTPLSSYSCTTVSILQVCPSAGSAVKEHVLGPALLLSTSSLVQDHALDSLLALFKQMIVSNAIDFDELHALLRQKLTHQVGKHGLYNLGKCIAVITASASHESRQKVLNEILALLTASKTPTDADGVLQVQLSLIVTGDVGRMIDLSSLEDVGSRLKAIYVGYFESSSEDLKNAAAYALGNASVGAPCMFLQAIIGKLEDKANKKQQYLLLSALREYIQSASRVSGGDVGVMSSLPAIFASLEGHCSDEEEGVRTMVAECLGSLTCLQPAIMLKHLENMQNAHSAIEAPNYEIADDDTTSKKNALICWTVATSIKLCISGKVDSTQLALHMPTFVKLLQQDELNVRNAALLMVYSAVHHMPSVVSALMRESIMPSLYEVARLKRERKVDLGPFTHTVDDALPHRKAALSIFATCLDNMPGSLDTSEFMPILATALGDAEDIQLHAHQIVISMCSRQPTSIVSSLDSFIDPLEKTINKKPGQKTGTELDRMNDWIKSALRVILTLTKVDGSVNSPKWVEFVDRVKSNTKFAPLIASLTDER
jgi:cullin-associated NEDD8-dissociated protein 1